LRRAITIVAIGITVLVLAIVLIQIFATPTLAQWRDGFVIVIGFFVLVWAILMIGVSVAVLALINMLRQKTPELMDQASSTAETVRGTTTFVGERVVSPFIKVSAAAAGARAAVQSVMRRDDGQNRQR